MVVRTGREGVDPGGRSGWSTMQNPNMMWPGGRAVGGALRQLIVVLGVLVLTAGGGLYWLSRDTGPDAAEAALHEVGMTSFEIVLTANGELESAEQVVLRSELESRSSIVEIVPEGEMVEEGDVLVRLSTDEIEKNLDNELLSLESARSDVVSAENALAIQKSDNDSSLRQAEINLELAQIELEKWLKGDDEEQRRQLTLNLEAAEREVKRLEDKVESSRRLNERDFLSNDALQQDELSLLRAQADLERARIRQTVYMEYERKKEETRLRSDVREASAELERTKRRNESELASRAANLTNRKRQLALREERVEKLREQIEAATMRAPSSGLVVYATSVGSRRYWGNDDGPFRIGSQINPNQDIIVLPSKEDMVARVKIHESLVGQVEPGQPARVKVDAARGTVFTGEVVSVGILAESGGWRDPNLREYTVDVALDLEGNGHGLKPSMRAEAELIVAKVEEVVAVPAQAVFFERGRGHVFTPSGAKFKRTPVRTARRSDTFVEVTSGLEPGDVVLTRAPKLGEVVEEAEGGEGSEAVADAPRGRGGAGARAGSAIN